MNASLPLRLSIWGRAVQLRGLADLGGLRQRPGGKAFAWSQPARVPLTVRVLRDGEDSTDYFVDVARASDAGMLAYYSQHNPSPTQWFARSAIQLATIVRAYDYSEPRLGVIRFPTIGDTANDLLFNITDDTGNQITTVPARVDVAAQVEAEAAARDVVVVERLDDGQWRVAGGGLWALGRR